MIRLNQINIELLELSKIDENWARVTASRLLAERDFIIEIINLN